MKPIGLLAALVDAWPQIEQKLAEAGLIEPDPTPATGAGESATPETDAEKYFATLMGGHHDESHPEVVDADFARRLERERNAALLRAEAAEREVAELRPKLRRECEGSDFLLRTNEALQADLAKAREEAAGLRASIKQNQQLAQAMRPRP